MVKNTTLREDKVLEKMKKSFPTYRFGNYLDMARLVQADEFAYKNRSRLETQFTKDIKQTLADITLLMQYLSNKNKSDILTSPEFNNHMKRIMDYSKFGKIDEDFMASFYSNMVQFGIKGISQNLPKEFTPLIEEHMKPLILLLNSITSYSKQVGKKGQSAYSPFGEIWDNTL